MSVEKSTGQDWLDALAGRAPAGTDADAERLRAALLPLPEVKDLPDWRSIEAAAGAQACAGATPSAPPGAAAVVRGSREAANQPRLRPVLPWAAALVLALGLGLWMAPSDEPALRGDAATGAAAVWLTPDAHTQGQALAAELRGAGAAVRIEPDGAGWVLYIEAPSAARTVVDARLQALETALDLEGRLTLRVRSGR